jgi:hypothetical protein
MRHRSRDFDFDVKLPDAEIEVTAAGFGWLRAWL